MTQRVISGQTYTLGYNAENRLTQVTGAATANFTYDGDGNRVTATEGITTTIYISNYFEWTTSTANMVKYYYAGAVRVAMRKGTANPLWLLGDHLGSTSIVANNDGSYYTGQGYKAWGEKRYPAGASPLPTTFRYTGQRESSYIKLMWFGSRWFDPELGRWAQPDSIIPDFRNPQSFDRYSYVYNSPIKYTDPNGHCIWDLCIMEGIGLVEVVLVVAASVTVSEYFATGGPEKVAQASQDFFELVEDNATNRLRSLAKEAKPRSLTPDEKVYLGRATEEIDDFIKDHPDLPQEVEDRENGIKPEEGKADHSLCDYNSETTSANNLGSRAEEKTDVSGHEW